MTCTAAARAGSNAAASSAAAAIAARLVLAVAALLAVSGCAPFAAPAPLVVAETAEVLAPGAWSATVVGGGGTALLDGTAGGGGARLRVGVGSRQLGIEGLIVATDAGGGSQPWEGQHVYYGGKLSWKLGFSDYGAVIAGLGGAVAGTGPSFGGDLAIIGSTRGRVAKYYGGVRGFFALPVGRRFYEAGGPGGGFMPVHGVAIRLAPSVQLFLENGWPILFGRGILEDGDRQIQNHAHFALYGALGVAFTF